jgi:hypothetical protein
MAFCSTFRLLPPFLHPQIILYIFQLSESATSHFLLHSGLKKKDLSWLNNSSLLHICSHNQGSSKLSNFWLAVILQTPCLDTGPSIFLKIFLSNVNWVVNAITITA